MSSFGPNHHAHSLFINMDSGATSRDSFNVSSTTDNGTGDRTVTATNAMGNTSYAIFGIGITSTVTSGSTCHVTAMEQDKTTTVQRFVVVDDRSTSSPPGRENSAACYEYIGDVA